jgi:Rv2525c-like, glycoside hydrolase-like domain
VPTLYAYGADYSSGEFTPAQLDAYHASGGYDLRVLIRYIGYPANPKCISYHHGAYQNLVDSGRLVLLVHEIGNGDAAGGWSAGQRNATVALNDARSIGYPEELPIFMAADGWLASQGISVPTAMSYLRGAASVLGGGRTGAYGFTDFVYPAQDQGLAGWFWLCGAESGVRDGIQIYQVNNHPKIHPTNFDIDINKVYFDPNSIAGGGFLMALEQWKQDRIFERILSMSQGVAGQNLDGDQFAHEQLDRQLLQSKLDTLTQHVQTLMAKMDAAPPTPPVVLPQAQPNAKS